MWKYARNSLRMQQKWLIKSIRERGESLKLKRYWTYVEGMKGKVEISAVNDLMCTVWWFFATFSRYSSQFAFFSLSFEREGNDKNYLWAALEQKHLVPELRVPSYRDLSMQSFVTCTESHHWKRNPKIRDFHSQKRERATEIVIYFRLFASSMRLPSSSFHSFST